MAWSSRAAIGIVAVIIGLFGLQVAGAQNQPNDLDIDPAIQGEERRVIAQVMRGLPHEYWRDTDILYVTADQRVFSNRLRLKREFRFLAPVGDRIFQDSRGDIIVTPGPERVTRGQLQPGILAVTPTCDGTTGPYRRVHTVPGKGQVKAYQLYLPGPSAIWVAQPGNETPYVLLGGWGKNAGAVEGGFQYSSTYANWTLMLFVEGRAPIPDPNPRFRVDQTVQLTFGAASVNQAYVAASGRDINGNFANRRLVVTDLPPEWGWSYTGNGMVLKRTTSIAQTTQNFQTGSYFRNVDWIETWLQSGLEYWHRWRSDETGGTCNWPDSQKVQVTVRRPDSELVSIELLP